MTHQPARLASSRFIIHSDAQCRPALPAGPGRRPPRTCAIPQVKANASRRRPPGMSSLTCGRCPATAALALPSVSQMFTGDGLQSLLFPETGAWGLLCLRGRVLKANPDSPAVPSPPAKVGVLRPAPAQGVETPCETAGCARGNQCLLSFALPSGLVSLCETLCPLEGGCSEPCPRDGGPPPALAVPPSRVPSSSLRGADAGQPPAGPAWAPHF